MIANTVHVFTATFMYKLFQCFKNISMIYTHHVGSKHHKHTKPQTFEKAMFRETSEAVKKYAQPCFSTEFSTRCLTEHAMLYYGGVVSRVTKRMPMLRNNLVKCYDSVLFHRSLYLTQQSTEKDYIKATAPFIKPNHAYTTHTPSCRLACTGVK